MCLVIRSGRKTALHNSSSVGGIRVSFDTSFRRLLFTKSTASVPASRRSHGQKRPPNPPSYGRIKTKAAAAGSLRAPANTSNAGIRLEGEEKNIQLVVNAQEIYRSMPLCANAYGQRECENHENIAGREGDGVDVSGSGRGEFFGPKKRNSAMHRAGIKTNKYKRKGNKL
ncbi:hypothetical protein SVAN01_04310 [Stagonosporopsis vannaccii]|nr:hypothetical protein SVAN01_04310 [Stagonosporopsis vannaccii]